MTAKGIATHINANFKLEAWFTHEQERAVNKTATNEMWHLQGRERTEFSGIRPQI